MATIKEIKDAFSKIGSAGPINVKQLTRVAIKKSVTTSNPNLSDEEAEEVTDLIMDSENSPLYQQVKADLEEISMMVTTLPAQAAALQAQIASIPASVVGTAAAAAGPMVLSVKSQMSSLGAMLKQTFSKAALLNIDIPGIDPLIALIDVVGPFL